MATSIFVILQVSDSSYQFAASAVPRAAAPAVGGRSTGELMRRVFVGGLSWQTNETDFQVGTICFGFSTG